MLAAQQEQMRICGDIHGVDLNIAFQNSTPFWSLPRFCPPFLSTQKIGPKVNTSTCLSCSISVEKYQCLGPSSYQCTPLRRFPKNVASMGPAMKEKNYIFMGDFVDRGRRFQKVEGSHLIFGKSLEVIPGFDEIRIQQCRNF